MVEEVDDWPDPVYDDHGRKHFLPSSVEWDRTVVSSTRDEPAYFHPSVAADVEALVLKCVREGTLFKVIGNRKRCYYMDAGRIIGASNGKETTSLYVERLKAGGTTHGRPITEEEIRRRS